MLKWSVLKRKSNVEKRLWFVKEGVWNFTQGSSGMSPERMSPADLKEVGQLVRRLSGGKSLPREGKVSAKVLRQDTTYTFKNHVWLEQSEQWSKGNQGGQVRGLKGGRRVPEESPASRSKHRGFSSEKGCTGRGMKELPLLYQFL